MSITTRYAICGRRWRSRRWFSGGMRRRFWRRPIRRSGRARAGAHQFADCTRCAGNRGDVRAEITVQAQRLRDGGFGRQRRWPTGGASPVPRTTASPAGSGPHTVRPARFHRHQHPRCDRRRSGRRRDRRDAFYLLHGVELQISTPAAGDDGAPQSRRDRRSAPGHVRRRRARARRFRGIRCEWGRRGGDACHVIGPRSPHLGGNPDFQSGARASHQGDVARRLGARCPPSCAEIYLEGSYVSARARKDRACRRSAWLGSAAGFPTRGWRGMR